MKVTGRPEGHRATMTDYAKRWDAIVPLNLDGTRKPRAIWPRYESTGGTTMFKAIVIPPGRDPMKVIEIPAEGALDTLQKAVVSDVEGEGAGYIEAVPLPEQILGDAADKATSYIDEEGKLKNDWRERVNMRATDFFVPGIGIFPNDVIVGPLVICGFDPTTGEHAELPAKVIRRVRTIARESTGQDLDLKAGAAS